MPIRSPSRAQFVAAAVFLSSCATSSSTSPRNPAPGKRQTTLREPSAALRVAYFQREFGKCTRRGAVLAQAHPHDARLFGWWLLCRSWIDGSPEIVADMQAFVAGHDADPWVDFVHAAGLARSPLPDESFAPIQRMLTTDGNDPDVRWLYALILSKRSRNAELIAFVDAAETHGQLTAGLLTLRASTRLAVHAEDLDNARSLALADLARARDLEPNHAESHWLSAEILRQADRYREAITLLEQGLAIAPTSVPLHQLYWNIYHAHGPGDVAVRRERLAADVHRSLADHPDRVDLRRLAANTLRNLKRFDEAEELEAWVLLHAPDSSAGEGVRYDEVMRAYGRAYDNAKATTTRLDAKDEFHRLAWAFLDSPTQHDTQRFGTVYTAMRLAVFAEHRPSRSGLKLRTTSPGWAQSARETMRCKTKQLGPSAEVDTPHKHERRCSRMSRVLA